MTKRSKATPETEVSPTGANIADIKAALKKKADGEEVTLPSGLVFKLIKPSISKLMKSDIFPSELVAVAIQMDSSQMLPKTKKEYLDGVKVMDIVVKHACLVPGVVMTREEETDDNVFIDDIEDMDRIAIYLYAQTGVKPELKSFRSEQTD